MPFKKRSFNRKVVDPKTGKIRFVGSDAEQILGTMDKFRLTNSNGFNNGIDVDYMDERETNIRHDATEIRTFNDQMHDEDDSGFQQAYKKLLTIKQDKND